MDCKRLAEEIPLWMEEQVHRAGARGVVFGLSGGVDSAVVAALAKRAFGDQALGLILPCRSSVRDIKDARRVAAFLGLRVEEIDLGKPYDILLSLLPKGSPMARANVKPRLRMVVLYYVANARGYLVVGTGNRSEITVGYFCKHGDGGVDLLPIGDLVKSEVRELARYLGLPKRIIDKPPSAGLWKGQTDEKEMGIAYEDLDRILLRMDAGESLLPPSEPVARVQAMIARSAHKREPIPMFRPCRT